MGPITEEMFPEVPPREKYALRGARRHEYEVRRVLSTSKLLNHRTVGTLQDLDVQGLTQFRSLYDDLRKAIQF